MALARRGLCDAGAGFRGCDHGLRAVYQAAAAERWEEALHLYPVSPTALTARYHLGLCYRGRAERESQNHSPVDAPEIRSHYRSPFGWLVKAAAHFQKLVDDLQARQAVASLPE